MVSTRLASPNATLGFSEPGQRNRVDPVKLLDLIHRIKTATNSEPSPLVRSPSKPVVKAS